MVTTPKGKWAEGIPPRNFTWVLRDGLAVSERPGGYSRNHRKVRRHEEIIWLKVQGFTMVISLLASPHNLHAYDEQGLAWSHRPLGSGTERAGALVSLYQELHGCILGGGQVLIHAEEMDDEVAGVAAGYLLWSRRVPGPAQAIVAIERLTRRQLGPDGRELVAIATAAHASRSQR